MRRKLLAFQYGELTHHFQRQEQPLDSAPPPQQERICKVSPGLRKRASALQNRQHWIASPSDQFEAILFLVPQLETISDFHEKNGMWHSAQLWIETRKTTPGSRLEFEDGSQRRSTGKVDKEENDSCLHVNSQHQQQHVITSKQSQDSLLSGRFRRKQIFSKGRNKGHLAATAVLKLPCHKHRTTGFSFLLLQRQKAIAPLKFHWVFFFCFAETDTSLDRVLSPAKSHGSKTLLHATFSSSVWPCPRAERSTNQAKWLAAPNPEKLFHCTMRSYLFEPDEWFEYLLLLQRKFFFWWLPFSMPNIKGMLSSPASPAVLRHLAAHSLQHFGELSSP